MIESDILKTESSEQHAHDHAGTIVPEVSPDDSHTHSVEEIEADHEEGHHEHVHHQQQRSTVMKSRLVPVFVGLVVSLVIIGNQSAKASVKDIRNINRAEIITVNPVELGISDIRGVNIIAEAINGDQITAISSGIKIADKIEADRIDVNRKAIDVIDQIAVGNEISKIDSIGIAISLIGRNVIDARTINA